MQISDEITATPEVAAPEPDLTPEVSISRAEAMRDTLRGRQDETEDLGRPPVETFEAFREAGFYRALQPRRFGGHEFDMRTFLRIVVEVARGCPSSGWNLSLSAGHAVTVAHFFDEEAQREIFGPDGDFRAPLPAAPTGRATKTDDGWIVAGRWDYASGSPESNRFLAVAVLDDGSGGDGPPSLGLVCVPDEWRVLDNWGGILGMRGSGSDSVVVEDAHIRDNFVYPHNILELDLSEPGFGWQLHRNPLYAGQTMAYFNLELVPVIIGTALAAIDEYESILTTKKTQTPPFALRREDPEHQRTFGHAVALAATAERALLACADDYIAYARRGAEGGAPFSLQEDGLLSMVLRQAGSMAADAVESIFAAAGSSAAADGQRMQRYLRDVQTYRTHLNSQRGLWARRWAAEALEAETSC